MFCDTAFQHEVDETLLKKGYVRMKGRIFGKSWKKKILVLHGPSSHGPSRLVRYSNEKSLEELEPSLEISLKDVSSAIRCKMSEGSHGDGITLKMTDGSIKQFLCDSESESNDWLNVIQPELKNQNKLPDGMFRVYLLPCATLNYHGECILHVTEDLIHIYRDELKSNQITECHITHIRRFGADSKKKQFLIEVGSKCPTGEGIYLFRTIYFEDIHARVERSAAKLREKSLRRNPIGKSVMSEGAIYENEKI